MTRQRLHHRIPALERRHQPRSTTQEEFLGSLADEELECLIFCDLCHEAHEEKGVPLPEGWEPYERGKALWERLHQLPPDSHGRIAGMSEAELDEEHARLRRLERQSGGNRTL
ncbi:MAG: hypothetical protein HY347_04315 [candidate division NC10 bacterium]|nr:hypothetical protein [candidate division NC10 bacterium]